MPTFRDATFWDIRTTAGVLAATLLPTPLGRWLEPEPVARGRRLFHYHVARVTEAIQCGTARVVEDRDQVIAAALWLPCLTLGATAETDSFGLRLGQLGAAAGQPHLQQPHLRLAGLGVLPRWQRRGLATGLLTEQAQPSPQSERCLAAVEGPFAALAAGCGYRPYGVPVRLTPGEGILRGMLHTTEGSPVRSRNAVPARYGVGSAGRATASAVTARHEAGRDAL